MEEILRILVFKIGILPVFNIYGNIGKTGVSGQIPGK